MCQRPWYQCASRRPLAAHALPPDVAATRSSPRTGRPFGAVTLYSQHSATFGTESLAPGLTFAQQASIAITVAVEREQLLNAADSRGIVGQAQGILMERYQITSDQAFALIRRSSSALNQKLRWIAERIIAGCSLPDIDRYPLPHVVGATSIEGGFDHGR